MIYVFDYHFFLSDSRPAAAPELESLGIFTFMNTYIVILSDRNEPHLRETFAAFELEIRQLSPKVLAILPNILLFQTEKDLPETYSALPKLLHLGGRALLFHIEGKYRYAGTMTQDRLHEFARFFSPLAADS